MTANPTESHGQIVEIRSRDIAMPITLLVFGWVGIRLPYTNQIERTHLLVISKNIVSSNRSTPFHSPSVTRMLYHPLPCCVSHTICKLHQRFQIGCRWRSWFLVVVIVIGTYIKPDSDAKAFQAIWSFRPNHIISYQIADSVFRVRCTHLIFSNRFKSKSI